MVDYGVTADGFVLKPLSIIRQEVQDAIRANIDAGLSLDDQSILGQLEAIFSDKIGEQWEVGQGVYASEYPDSANGFALDEVCSITGTTRDDASKTAGTGRVQLDAFTTLSTGAVAHAASRPSARFVTTADAVNNTASVGVWVNVPFLAETAGATTVAGETSLDAYDGQLSVIAEPETGWLDVDNVDAFVTGTDLEEDPELRDKRENELESQGSTNVDSIKADLLRATGVTDCSVFENVTDSYDANGLKPHSVHCVVQGGTAQDICEALYESKASGIDTNGALSYAVTDTQGYDHVIYYDDADIIVTYVDLDIQINGLTWGYDDGIIEVKDNVAAYINALRVGEDVIVDQIKCAASRVSGVYLFNSVELDIVDPPVATIDLDIGRDEFATSDVLNIRLYIDGVLQVIS